MTSPPPAQGKGLSTEEEEKAKALLHQLMVGDKKPSAADSGITSDDEGVRVLNALCRLQPNPPC